MRMADRLGHCNEGGASNPLRAAARKLHPPLPLVACHNMRVNRIYYVMNESNSRTIFLKSGQLPTIFA